MKKLIEQLDLKKFKELSQTKTPALIEFHSNGCHYCTNLEPVIYELASKYSDIEFYKINIDKYPTIPQALGFSGVPAILLYNVAPNKKYQFLEEPPQPNKKTWYSKVYIEKFIREHHKGTKNETKPILRHN